MSREGERCTLAEVFLDRIRYNAEQAGMSVGVLLGHAIAHEIGHLLLRTSGHTGGGIMRARWNSQDLLRATKGQLLFTSGQAEHMRGDATSRWEQAE